MPSAAAWCWRITADRMRRLALDGRLEFRVVRGVVPQASRAYTFDALVARWGDPDPDRFSMLHCFEVLHLTGPDPNVGVMYEIHAMTPSVDYHEGDYR